MNTRFSNEDRDRYVKLLPHCVFQSWDDDGAEVWVNNSVPGVGDTRSRDHQLDYILNFWVLSSNPEYFRSTIYNDGATAYGVDPLEFATWLIEQWQQHGRCENDWPSQIHRAVIEYRLMETEEHAHS